MKVGEKLLAQRGVDERNALIVANLKLVPWAIFEKRPRLRRQAKVIGYRDVISIGYDALLRAAELWNEEKGTFSNYAIKCIRWRVVGAVTRRRNPGGDVMLPVARGLEI